MLGWEFKFFLTVPLVWTFVLSLFDYSKNIEALFFARTLDRIYKKKDHIREGCRKKPENCPIFKVLKEYNSTSDINYSKMVGNIPIARILEGDVKDEEKKCVIWSLIKGMGSNYQQAAFFEIVAIQFFVAFLMIDSGLKLVSLVPPDNEILIKNFYLVISIVIFVWPLFFQTYVFQENSTSFTHLRYRVLLISACWLFLMAF